MLMQSVKPSPLPYIIIIIQQMHHLCLDIVQPTPEAVF